MPGLIYTRRAYDDLFSYYAPIGIGVFALFALAIVFAVIRYRGRPPSAAARWHENDRLEGAYALLLACVVAFLLYLTYSAEHKVDSVSAHEQPRLTVDVVASKWEWTFSYPAYGITARSGAVGDQPLVVPTGEAVRFELSSLDVIHSFWIPALRFKRAAFPGHTQNITLAFGSTGLFQGQCAEFCGLRHPEMIFSVRVVTPQQFTAWAARGGGS
ncbi:MAG TPA: cytochrome c oxidase subunit II [Solirubrobacteraceae bacterium]|nr:cytochrome c oxidase subunit II [Solirubrobacteraceae bacterium]